MKKEKTPFLKRTWVQWVLAISTISSIGWAVFEHYYTREPNVRFEIVSEAQLFNDSERVSSIRLYIDSLDIRNQNLNVRLYTIKVSNRGRKDLGSSEYEGLQFGISIKNGVLLNETVLTGASNDYINEAFPLLMQEATDSLLLLPKLAMDIDDWYEISIALLHEKGEQPELSPVGKILGQHSLSISPIATKESLPFFSQVFYGGFWVHLVRIVLGFVVLMSLALLLAITGEEIDAFNEKRYSRELLNTIISDKKIPSFIRNDVLENGLESIQFAGERINKGIGECNKSYEESKVFVENKDSLSNPTFEAQRSEYVGYQDLIKKGYMMIDADGKLSMPGQVEDSVKLIYTVITEHHLWPHVFKRALKASSIEFEG